MSTPGILIVHTPSQLEEASSLVDLLEASLSLGDDAILCSSLPGYRWSAVAGASFGPVLDSIAAAIAIVDESALHDRQLWFDLAAVWARGKRVAVLVDDPSRRHQLPAQLEDREVVTRTDRRAVVSLIEDIAFDLGVEPRIGQDAQRALVHLSSTPPPVREEIPTVRPPAAAARPSTSTSPPTVPRKPPARPPVQEVANDDSYESIETVPPPALVPLEAHSAEEPTVAAIEGALELSEDDVEPLHGEALLEADVSYSLAVEAGRAIGECSFHRDSGGDFASELASSFGRFVDSVGGSWADLSRLGDVELWLGATDNLLEGLPSDHQNLAEWYELGFQFATLQAVAEQGWPSEADQREAFEQLWNQSMAAFRQSALAAQVAPREVRSLQSQLENLIGPEHRRDYGNIARSLDNLRSLARGADREARVA